MTTTDGPACPSCPGRQMVGHPCGWLAWRHTNDCPIRAVEDGRVMADHDLLRDQRTARRPSTGTERALLTTAGHTITEAEGLVTVLEPASQSLIRRRWPSLEPDESDAA